jgi:hypothetical protein
MEHHDGSPCVGREHGFHPAPPAAIAGILRHLKIPDPPPDQKIKPGDVIVLDHCAGEAQALVQLAEGLIFVDTGAWFARFVPSDSDHPAAREWFDANTSPLVTTDYVIDELLSLLKVRGEFGRAVEIGGAFFTGDVCNLEWVTKSDVTNAWLVFSKLYYRPRRRRRATVKSAKQQPEAVQGICRDTMQNRQKSKRFLGIMKALKPWNSLPLSSIHKKTRPPTRGPGTARENDACS